MSLGRTLYDMIPVPIAAPETNKLRRQRLTLIWVSAAIAVLVTVLPFVSAQNQSFLAILIAGLLSFWTFEGIFYFRSKSRHDNHGLDELCEPKGAPDHEF